MKKQLTVLGLFVILTGLSLTSAHAQVRVIIGPPVCTSRVVYQHPTHYYNHSSNCGSHHGHGNCGHHNHGNHGHRYGNGNNNGHGNHHDNGNHYGNGNNNGNGNNRGNHWGNRY